MHGLSNFCSTLCGVAGNGVRTAPRPRSFQLVLAPNFLTAIGLLRLEQSGPPFLTYAVLPMFVLVPLSIYLIRHYDVKVTLIKRTVRFFLGGAARDASNP